MLAEFFCWALFFLLPAPYCADNRLSPDRVLLRASSQTADLEFPAQPVSLSTFEAPRMAIFKPEGAGLFLGLVLLRFA